MAIFLVYSTSGIACGEKVCYDVKIVVIWKLWTYLTHLQFDLRYEKIVPNYARKRFVMVTTPSMMPQSVLKFALYIHV